jgi:ribosome-binding protein aMBF1 (putative translation factor)
MTGTQPQTVAIPESCRIVYCAFGVTSTRPLSGTKPLSQFVQRLEANPDTARRLAKARQTLAPMLDEVETIRRLRLAAGLSQAKVAARARTAQSYIARVEAGTVDPGTDMLARIANAIGSDPVTVFRAVRNQRAQREATSVG